MEKLNLTQEWDKVFPKSDKVDHKKVTFHNRYAHQHGNERSDCLYRILPENRISAPHLRETYYSLETVCCPLRGCDRVLGSPLRPLPYPQQ